MMCFSSSYNGLYGDVSTIRTEATWRVATTSPTGNPATAGRRYRWQMPRKTCLFFECQLDYQYISDTIHSCHGLDIKWIETAVLLEICPRMYTIVLQRSHITGYELDVQKIQRHYFYCCVFCCVYKEYIAGFKHINSISLEKSTISKDLEEDTV